MPEEPYNPSPIGNPSILARRNWWQTMLVKFIGKHTPKCREMVRILSQSMDEPMPLVMRIKKRLHFLICCWCQRYEEQLRYMRQTAPSLLNMRKSPQMPRFQLKRESASSGSSPTALVRAAPFPFIISRTQLFCKESQALATNGA